MTTPGPAADARDEEPHPPGTGSLWSESYYLDFFDPERQLAGYVRMAFLPNLGKVWYWACVVRPGRPLVIVIDHEIELPADRSREIRAAGLRAGYDVRTPLGLVALGLETSASSLDDPVAAYRGLQGEHVPLGLDLAWETDGATYPYPGVDRYEVPCRVHGEIRVGSETIQLDGWGQRDHSWGERDWWSTAWSWTAGRLEDGTRFHGTSVDHGGVPVFGTGYVQPPGAPMVGTDIAIRSEELGPEGLPTAAVWQIADLEMTHRPVVFAPVLLTAADGRESRFPRAWTTVNTSDGRTGHTWTEWNQPPGR